ncbi:SsgA family sporulation/cell division regulator [Streptomyces sp. MK7]|uniref:SsgA family sporulation/cell division regulator n=1 Tax=Streptomyces sp. MK7 TaxID=3067635 RepID=UPI00292CFBE1|nr:SsgA family sporulation/cell division regulator [Streptomyces sp. MK7]
MTVRKDEPMDHLAATDDEFDALLDASSLGAPHVVAETGDIPATARRRMAQAVRQQRRILAPPGDTSHPAMDDADSQPEAPANAERPSQQAQPVHRGILYAATGSGKSAILAALFASWHGTHIDSSPSSRRQSLTRWLSTEPSTDGLRSTAWLAGAFDETGAVRPQDGIAHDDEIGPLSKRHDALAELVASMPRCARIEGQALSTVTAAALQLTRLLWPDDGTRTSPVLHAVSSARKAHKPQGLWNLRHLMEPHVHHDQSLGSAMTTALLMRSTPVTGLLISRFTTCAYTAVGSGLLVPKADGAPRHRHRLQETGTTGRDLRQPRGTHRMKLRRALIDGLHELSAELPMLFHLDERESLALTSSLHTRLTYRVSDPYAVEARFRADDRDETVWTFARDLLKNGLERRNGLGDVVVWPGTGTQGEPRVFVRLSSPEGTALLSAADADLRAFLAAASNLVSYGAEHPHLAPALDALETTIGELARPGRCE